MHPNFYHWHSRVELKPAPTVLQARWDAAAKFGKTIKAADISALLGLMFFSSAEPEFVVRFGGELIKAEPTFPLDSRDELMRVMAAATLSSVLEGATTSADAVALGVRASAFGGLRIESLWQDIHTQALRYLTNESERVRPQAYTAEIDKTEKQIIAQLANLKKVAETNEPSKIGEATHAAITSVSAAVKDSHKQLGLVIERLAEESQFLWWLVTAYSPTLKKRRANIIAAGYVITSAAEAADRVNALPPSESVPSLLEAVLGQCSGEPSVPLPLADLIKSLDAAPLLKISIPMLTPLSGLLAEFHAGNVFSTTTIARFQLPADVTMSPVAAAQQRFHEVIFVRALSEVA